MKSAVVNFCFNIRRSFLNKRSMWINTFLPEERKIFSTEESTLKSAPDHCFSG
jgi:hypothetical protein